jgi:hypothetical protein
MSPLLSTPIEQLFARWWSGTDRAAVSAFIAAAGVSLLAFGFEMTNLTLHHDDLSHLMVQKPLVGYFLGRFVHSWLFFFGLQGQFAPFLHMTVGLLLMCAYGVIVARFWGAERALDIALAAALLCVFPYMAHVYQYNSVMVAYPLAHLLVASAVVLAVRGRAIAVAVAAVLFFLAFSIYQAVLANAATIFLVWLLMRVLFSAEPPAATLAASARAGATALIAVTAGGLLHVLAVSLLNIPFDSAQGADQAFSLRSRLEHGLQLSHAAAQVINGLRAFLFWPEAYLPQPVKLLQQLLLAGAALCCLAIPRRWPAKAAALALLGLAVLSPRTMQLLHPQGNFHQLTLTAYGLVIAAALLVALRAGPVLLRNLAVGAATILIAGYVMQCAWISTVNYLNTQAHVSTMTQILARLRSLPGAGWDGRTVAVVGSYEMSTDFPYKPATGVASQFLNPWHMTRLARLMRDEATFVRADATMPKTIEFAAGRKAWPHPDSVGIVDGVAVIVLSNRGTSGAATPGE